MPAPLLLIAAALATVFRSGRAKNLIIDFGIGDSILIRSVGGADRLLTLWGL